MSARIIGEVPMLAVPCAGVLREIAILAAPDGRFTWVFTDDFPSGGGGEPSEREMGIIDSMVAETLRRRQSGWAERAAARRALMRDGRAA